jgi:2'-hydroxyisoflavone reductase
MLRKQKILILGGTEFVGRQLVEKLMSDKNFELYLFNRGKTNPEIFPSVNRIVGDRDSDDINQIKEHNWDYVVDFSCYFPNSLKKTLKNLNKDVKSYVFVSSISVYDLEQYDGSHEIDEEYRKLNYTEEQLLEPGFAHYGEKKKACEDILLSNGWLNSTTLRPSIIYGKYDPTDRLYYWLYRIRNQSEILLPDDGKFKMSITSSSDLVDIIQQTIKGEIPKGVYNCVSNPTLVFKEILKNVRRELKSDCHFIPVDRVTLKEMNVSIYDFPFYWRRELSISNRRLQDFLGDDVNNRVLSFQETIAYYESLNWPLPAEGLEINRELDLLGRL